MDFHQLAKKLPENDKPGICIGSHYVNLLNLTYNYLSKWMRIGMDIYGYTKVFVYRWVGVGLAKGQRHAKPFNIPNTYKFPSGEVLNHDRITGENETHHFLESLTKFGTGYTNKVQRK